MEPVVTDNLERHLDVAKEWFPHDYVPWSQGRDYDGLMEGEAWAAEQSKVPDVARTSLIVNLLTEDNLPSYHHEIATVFGRDGAWGTWVHRWTAEEGRHGIAIRDYLLTTRAVDPVQLERLRMEHMSTGYTALHDDMVRSLAYVSFQELATRVSHRNTGKITGDAVGDQLLARVAADENLHMVFYRNLLGAALELDPSQTMRAITDVVTQFAMPCRPSSAVQRCTQSPHAASRPNSVAISWW
jgi:acyl-[acyl-carrier-protein] desaturase